MTQNQIEYWKHRETKRSNQARETETNRANLVREAQTWRQIKDAWHFNDLNFRESQRRNRASETIQKDQLAEQVRHAKEQEKIQTATVQNDAEKLKVSRGQLAEQHRTNLANEQIRTEQNKQTQYRDTRNANIAAYKANNEYKIATKNYAESVRSHLASENLSAFSNSTARFQAQSNRQLGFMNYNEAVRAHLASENLTREGHAVQLATGFMRTLGSALGRVKVQGGIR